MRPYETLTVRGQIRRLRRAAGIALRQFGIEAGELRFLAHQEVTSFRVRRGPDDWLLKVDPTATNTPGTLDSMMAWIEALGRDTDLPVPAPVRTIGGDLHATVEAEGVPGTCLCTLQHWVRGRQYHRTGGVRRYEALGRVMAELHEQAATWTPPAGFVRRDWDREGILCAADQGLLVPGSTFRDLHEEPLLGAFEAVGERVREAMEELGEGPEVFGMIHADLHLWNVVFQGGHAVPIDFNDCGPGYYVYDLAVPIEHRLTDPEKAPEREAILRGYASVRPPPPEFETHLAVFVVCRTVGNAQWVAGEARRNEKFRRHLPRFLDRALRVSREFLAGDSPITAWLRSRA